MRFILGTAGLDPTSLPRLAMQAEEAGFDVLKVADSICYPEVSDSTYPYNRTGSRTFLDGVPFLDPFVAIAAMASVTERIGFVTSVLKLPMRHPILVAKQVSSVAVLSGGRVALGVGSSPWPDDYELLGVPMERRGRRMDEAVAIIRGLLEGGYHEHHGEVFDLPSIKIDPVPAAPVPILFGGHAPVSLARAARTGDGWIAAGEIRDRLPEILATLTTLRVEAGRADAPFEVHLGIDAGDPVDEVLRLADLGVTHVAVNFRDRYALGTDARADDERTAALGAYASTVIEAVRART